MKYIISLFLVFCLASHDSFAQELRHEIVQPGRSIESNKPKSYPDSVEFNKLFNELYPTIKPALSVHETAEAHFKALSRTFKMTGIDSAEAAKVAFKNLDENSFRKIYYDTYRKNLSAKELKTYMEFIKTPEGGHIAEVWGSLQGVLLNANSYVTHTININLTPLRQEARERMEKEQPPNNPNSLKSPNRSGDVFNGNPASMDSIMRAQHRQMNVQIPSMPSDTSGKK
jgi:hypothetical protein